VWISGSIDFLKKSKTTNQRMIRVTKEKKMEKSNPLSGYQI
jgi:hypothetical protein